MNTSNLLVALSFTALAACASQPRFSAAPTVPEDTFDDPPYWRHVVVVAVAPVPADLVAKGDCVNSKGPVPGRAYLTRVKELDNGSLIDFCGYLGRPGDVGGRQTWRGGRNG